MTVSGLAEPIDDAALKARWLAVHPYAALYADFGDFAFFRIRLSGTHLVAGFGRILDLKPEQFLTDVSDAGALIEAEQGAIEHMNADHREAMNLYATKLLGAEASDWRCSGIDPEGIDMQAGEATLRLDFPERVNGPSELRKMLVKLADQARTKV